MKQYKLLNIVLGWAVFAVAAVTYLMTMESTASFWDCGEFIATATKLDVGHPPGAPFFMLLGKFFTLFAADKTQIPVMINTLSALASAFTILFLFWTVTHLAKRVIIKDESKDFTLPNIIGILASGVVGALAYTFSDTFWFSAVEGEVYATSSFFTAIVFWAVLKWEIRADKAGSDRWLVFIAYLMGISVGIHLLNLLAIPAIVLVYYFKKYKVSAKGILLALAGSAAILVIVLYGIIPGFVELACWAELFFVNTLSMPYNTGLYIYILLVVGALVWGIVESYTAKSGRRMIFSYILAVTLVGIPFLGGGTASGVVLGILLIAALAFFLYYMNKKGKLSARWLNTSLAMITVILIGYSSYTAIVIRSTANPPMDQNSPDNVFALKYYLNREQYGDRPLFYGQYYNAPVQLDVKGNICIPRTSEGENQYTPKPKTSPDEKDEYIVTGKKISYKWDSRFTTLFPRMYSPQTEHVKAYKQWGNVKGRRVNYDYCGQQKTDYVPSFGENLQFFFDYQVNWMYLRYFMWNFSGRQNDIQGHGDIEHGNGITGIDFIDKMFVGDLSNMPAELQQNKGHNVYYMLPLLLGLIGIFFQLSGKKDGKQGFWIVFALFFLTGLAIVIYLNQTPFQPRERDYAYAGSFYAFSIWIGLGVLGLIKIFEKLMPKLLASSLISVAALGVPALMAQQNWDDHDRSGRYVARDFGSNYLHSLQPNAIIFTNGDNDTFPLWYNQEVEGVRTDVRVCNLSYLQTDWYIDQMKRGAYESAPLPISWQQKDYVSGKNDIVYVEDKIKTPLNINDAYNWLLSGDPQTIKDGEAFLPSTSVYIPVDAAQVLETGTLPAERANETVPQININLKRRLTKSELMILEMLRTNNWERPMYFAVTVGEDYYMGLQNHFELTGMAYRILPVNNGGQSVNTEEAYDNMMHKFRYGNIADSSIYLDENALRMCNTHRAMFVQLAQALYQKGDTARTLEVLNYSLQQIPGYNVRHNYISTLMADLYYKLGEPQHGDDLLVQIATDCVEYLDWYFSLPKAQQRALQSRIGHYMAVLNQALQIADRAQRKNIMDKFMPSFNKYYRASEI